MARLIRTDGTSQELQPANGVYWDLKELQILVGGYIEVVSTLDGKFMVIDDEGKLKRKSLNKEATRMYLYGRNDPIAGEAVVIDTRLEMNGPDEEEEIEEVEVPNDDDENELEREDDDEEEE